MRRCWSHPGHEGPAVSDDLAALAADAYIYGFPLVFDLQMAGGQAEMG